MVGTTAALIGAGVSAGGSLLGGLFGASAAKKASQQQIAAAQAAQAKVEDTVRQVNPGITSAANQISDEGNTSAKFLAGQTGEIARNAAAGVDTATQTANARLDPYAKAGTDALGRITTGLEVGGQFNTPIDVGDLSKDPAYQHRLKTGAEIIQKQRASRGAATGGGALKDLETFAQGEASSEYDKIYNRKSTELRDLFSRNQQVSDDGRLAAGVQGQNDIGSAKYGGDITTDASRFGSALQQDAVTHGGNLRMDAVNTTSSNTINGARTAADLLTQQGNAQAAGTIGRANALGGAVSGAASAVGNGLSLYGLLKKPLNTSGLNASAGITTGGIIGAQRQYSAALLKKLGMAA